RRSLCARGGALRTGYDRLRGTLDSASAEIGESDRAGSERNEEDEPVHEHSGVAVLGDVDERVRVPVDGTAADERVDEPCERIGEPGESRLRADRLPRRVDQPVGHRARGNEIVNDE